MSERLQQQPDLAALAADIDATAVAERVLLNPPRAALQVSTIEMLAVARRLSALEDLAADTFQLFANADALLAARGTPDEPQLVERHNAFVATLAGALEALGYHLEPENEENQKQD